MPTKLESAYQREVIDRIEARLPGCYAIKNNSAYMPGIPDWTIFYGRRWGMLEIKRKRPRPGSKDFQPNQEWYIERFAKMSFCMCLYPENEREVLDAIQQALRPRRSARVSNAKRLSLD